MRIFSSPGLTAELACLLSSWPLITSFLPYTQGVSFTPVSLPDVDLTNLGRVILTGDFDAISLYTYQQQTEEGYSTNGTQSLIVQLPNGDFGNAASADGYIKTLTPFFTRDQKLQGIIVGGNFTSLGGIAAQGIALYNPQTSEITPLPGLSGTVNTVYNDPARDTVYVGGQFKGLNSTNAIIWVGNTGWTNLPFEGFNGPVNTITKSPNGTVIFGGSFTGLGNSTAPFKANQQVVNIQSANFTSGGTSTLDGFNKENNIVCKSDDQDGAGNTWLLQDNAPGFWQASMNFGYEPSLLRIYNTHYQGRGTKTFRFTALPINGIMNFTYTDPDTGEEGKLCDALCPLSSNPSVKYQEFRFVNTVGMNAFRIDVSAWYGAGGGLDGIQLFQNDTFAYAENDLNEPTCANLGTPSRSTQTGPWQVMPSAQSSSRYLSADLPAQVNPDGVKVTLEPDITEAGNYSVILFTPGCQQDNSCAKRGIVNVTGTFSTIAGAPPPASQLLYQTNDFDKYDEIYNGPVDASTSGFRPSVTIRPISNQQTPITIVAQRVQFKSMGNGSSLLNGLYEFDPMAPVSSDSSNSTIDKAGANLKKGAIVNSLVTLGDTSFVAGNFSDSNVGLKNVMGIRNGGSFATANAGLNDQVSSMIAFENLLYFGGNFSNVVNDTVSGLSNVAAYDPSAKKWIALGAGVDGTVDTVVAFSINVTSGDQETCIAFNGRFSKILASGSNKAVDVNGFAVWVPSRQNWLRNLNLPSQAVAGKLSTMTNVTGGAPLLAGTLAAQDLLASDAVELNASPLRLEPVNLGIQPVSTGPQTRKRATSNTDVSGIVTGLFLVQNNLNVTILGGHFTAAAGDGSAIQNLALVYNGGSNPGVSGLPSGLNADSIFLSLATSNTKLYAGGSITGNVNNGAVNGFVVYDVDTRTFDSPQPPALGGNDVSVNAVTVPPTHKDQIFVGGNFETAGSLSCPGVCVFNNGVWSQPGSGFSGTVNQFVWQGNTALLAGGNLTVSGNQTSLATYDLNKQAWTAFAGAANSVPGPVTAMTPADGDDTHFWLAGKASNGSAYLMKYDGSKFRTIGAALGSGSTIEGLSMYNLKKSHGSGTDLVSNSIILMVLGELNLPNYGNASAALFNGTVFTPYALTNSGNSPGRLSQLFSEKEVVFKTAGGPMALGLVVLVALACALGAVFLLVVAGILIERYRRRREGYTPAPTTYFDKTSNMGRIPPEHLFGQLGENRKAPML